MSLSYHYAVKEEINQKNNFGYVLSPVQTDASLMANNCQHCWQFLRPFVAKSLTGFKTCATTPNSQQQATTWKRVCKRTQHVISNNVGSCWPTMSCLFARSLVSEKLTNQDILR